MRKINSTEYSKCVGYRIPKLQNIKACRAYELFHDTLAMCLNVHNESPHRLELVEPNEGHLMAMQDSGRLIFRYMAKMTMDQALAMRDKLERDHGIIIESVQGYEDDILIRLVITDGNTLLRALWFAFGDLLNIGVTSGVQDLRYVQDITVSPKEGCTPEQLYTLRSLVLSIVQMFTVDQTPPKLSFKDDTMTIDLGWSENGRIEYHIESERQSGHTTGFRYLAPHALTNGQNHMQYILSCYFVSVATGHGFDASMGMLGDCSCYLFLHDIGEDASATRFSQLATELANSGLGVVVDIPGSDCDAIGIGVALPEHFLKTVNTIYEKYGVGKTVGYETWNGVDYVTVAGDSSDLFNASDEVSSSALLPTWARYHGYELMIDSLSTAQKRVYSVNAPLAVKPTGELELEQPTPEMGTDKLGFGALECGIPPAREIDIRLLFASEDQGIFQLCFDTPKARTIIKSMRACLNNLGYELGELTGSDEKGYQFFVYMTETVNVDAFQSSTLNLLRSKGFHTVYGKYQ